MSFANNFNKSSLIFAKALAINSFGESVARSIFNKIVSEKFAETIAKNALGQNARQSAINQEGVSALVKTNNVAYRPKEWDSSELIYAKTNIGGYIFDAILKADHNSTLKITDHPIQNGANTADHAFLLPARLTVEIGMSDCMDSVIAGQFTSHKSKSISAFQILTELQANKTLIDITTRLKLYKHMLIEQINAPDDVKTLTGLRCSVTFKQIFVSEVNVVAVSARTHATTETTITAAQPVLPDATIAARIEEASFGLVSQAQTIQAH